MFISKGQLEMIRTRGKLDGKLDELVTVGGLPFLAHEKFKHI